MKPTPIVALDVPGITGAMRLVEQLEGLCTFYKVGSELFSAAGPDAVRALHDRGASVFLDLKFHDIPNTARGAVMSACIPGVRLLTVHASGGSAMIRAAVEAAGPDVGILAVTVLTSMDAAALGRTWGRDVGDIQGEVERLAGVALEGGARGVVCSGQECAGLRRRFGPRLELLVPGVRLAGSDRQDQSRVVTPGEAAAAGATYVVLGRTVTAAAAPGEAMARVLADLS